MPTETIIEMMADNEVFEQGLVMFKIMDRTGDTKHIWDPKNAAEIEAAKAMFDSLRKKGYAAYSVKKDGSQGKGMNTFDPLAGAMILVFVPPIVAG